MSHPNVVTIDSRSAPRALFSGDRLVEVDLPTGTRVAYPKQPLAPLKDVDAAIRYAINHPYNSEPLYALLRPGMKVTIAVDDISLPLPPMRRPDIRERVLTIVLKLLAAGRVATSAVIFAVAHAVVRIAAAGAALALIVAQLAERGLAFVAAFEAVGHRLGVGKDDAVRRGLGDRGHGKSCGGCRE